MKKLISSLLALIMVMGMFSGVVLFGSGAEFDINTYVFTQIPGIQDWDDTIMATYNELANTSGAKRVGTPASIATNNLKGAATQAIKLDLTSGMPSIDRVSFSTKGHVDDVVQSQLGDVYGDVDQLGTFCEYAGIRIAVVNENGERPSLGSLKFVIVGKESNQYGASWGNGCVPWLSYEAADASLTYVDGYYYLDFDNFTSGWGGTMREQLASGEWNWMWQYANMYIEFNGTNINTADSNGGALYISDMQLYKRVADTEGLNKLINEVEPYDVNGTYAAEIAAAKAALEANSFSEIEASKAALTAAKAALFDVNGYVKMPFGGLSNFTLAEVQQFANKGGLTDITFSDLDGKNVINIANAINGEWGEVAAIWTGKTYDQWRKNELVNGKSPFDIDLSNKLGFRFKLVNTGAEGTVPFTGNINLTMGSSNHAIALDWKDLKPDANGYYTIDFSLFGKWGKQFVGTDWYTTEFSTLADTFYKKIDQTAFVFYGTAGDSYSFYLDDFHAYGNANTTKLGELIQKAIGAGVAAEVIDAAKTVYMNTKATQTDVNAASKSLSDAMDKDLQILNAAKEELDTLIGAGYDNDAVYEANEDILLAADLVLSDTASTIDQLMFYVVELREKVALELVDEAYADILSKAFYAWESNYTKQSWASFAPALAAIWPYETATAEEFAALEAAYKALVPANIVTNDNLIFDDWTTEDVNAVVDANSGKLCDSIGTGHNGLFKDQDWNGGDFSKNTVFEAADGSFSMTTSVDLLDGSIGWKNMDRSTTLGGVNNGAYPALNVTGLNNNDGIRIKLDVDGYADRILIGLSNCSTMVEESYALNINPESVGADGYINIPFSYFENAWWCDPISNPENAIVFIVEVYGVTANTKVTLSDVRGYTMLNYTIPTLWEYNYTADSWAAYEAAIADVKTQEDVDAAVALLVAYPTVSVTGNLFEGWTNESINAVVNENGASQLKDSIGDGLNTNGVWNNGDFSNNTVFGGTDNFFMTATADFAGKSMGWKNLDRSGNLSGASMLPYPVLNNAEKLIDAEGLRFKLEVTDGTAERLLIGLSNCYRGNGTREMYALNIKPEYADAEGYINIPFTAFEKAWWTEAFAADELDEVLVFIVEAYGVSNGTTITFSDVQGYKEEDYVIPELWQYNYTADSWAAYQTALESVNSASALEAALALLVPYTANAVTGNLFEGWTTENINAVVNANGESQLKDSIGDGLNTNGVWNNGDFSLNTTFAGNNNFSMTATADFAGKSMGWKNLDRSGTLASASMGAYPALNTKGIADANGIAFKLAVTGGTAERLLIGLSNCHTMTREMYALNIKPEYVNEDGIIYIPFTAFEKAWWCDAFAADELDNIIVFIVEAYGVSNGATITISDIHGYAEGELEIPARWEYNYTADSWAAYKAAIADAKTGADVIAAEALLVALSTSAVTGNLFEGWTDESINAVVNENGASQLKDSIGDGLNTNGVWNNGDFSNNTVFGGTDNFFMTATADFAGKSMGWKNLDRSGNLSGASMLPYPVLNGAENLVGAEGLRFKLEVTGGTAERLLIGLSNCYRGNGTREMYALNIKPEYVGKDGYINIPFTAFEKAWWTEAFAADELDEVLVFIVEAYGVSNGTTITISDVRGYQEGSLVYPEIWEYNYTAESLAAYEAAIAAAKAQFEVDAAADLLVSAPTSATTGNLFEGWTTEDVNAVVNANSDKLCDSIGNGLNEKDVWNSGDFSNNTTFAANNSFSMTATADFTGKAMGWKNMDRSTTLGGVENGAYPALNIKGLNDAEGLRFKLDVDGSVERILIGLSNCSTMMEESYAINLKAEYVDAEGYINVPFSYFQKAWWANPISDPENAIVFIIEAYGATNGTTVTISDIHGYKYFFAANEEDIADLGALTDKLAAFDIDGRYADLIAEARSYTVGDDSDAVEAIYDEVMAVLEGVGDPDAAIVDVPGYSIYTQEELNQFRVRGGTATIIKDGDGIKVSYSKGSYWLANGSYAGNGYEDGDIAYGGIAAVNGKTIIDMLGGYSLADIYAYRFKIQGGSAYTIMAYKDGVGIYSGMATNGQTVYIDGGYYTFKTSGIPTNGLDGWYNPSFTRDQIREKARFFLADFTANQNKTIYGWQVILFETIDRSALKALLTDEANANASWYEDAMDLYYDASADQNDIDWFIEDVEFEDALAATANLWEYNYTAESWAAYEAALEAAEYAADVEAAIALLEILEGEAVTGNLFEGWTDEAINAVVNANGEGQLKPSIGDGLNKDWNAGDFSLNTTFGGTDGFFMTATADFVNGSMGWKNLDRSGTLADAAMGGYPVLNDATSLVKAEGLRIKLNVTGDVERILIGLSNCQRPNGVREMYALNVKPEYVAADGYINIPFSYFEKAWWCDAFAQDELDETIVFIIEAYNVANGSTVAIEDIYGYSTKTFGAENEAKADALAAEIEAYDFLGYYDVVVADLKALSADDYYYGAMATLEEAEAANLVPAYDNLDDLKAAIQALDAELPAVVEAINVYYAPASQDAVDAAVLALTKIINTPDAPVLGLSSTDSTITVDPIEGVEYRINGGEWTTDNVFTGLNANTEYTVEARYAETATANASEITSLVMRTELGSFGGASVVISGVERYLGTLTAEVIDFPEYLGSYSVAWYNAAGEVVGNGAELVIDAALIGTQVYAVVTSVNATDIVTSETSGVIGKALITEYTAPTASEIQYPQLLGESVLTGGEVAGITGTWAWVTPDAQPLSSQSGSAFDVTFTPDAEFIDLYEVLEVKVPVTVNRAPFEPRPFDGNGFTVFGNFMEDAEMFVEDITYDQAAYLALLRAASRDTSGFRNLVLFKNVDFTVNGEALDEIYEGTLTVTSFVGESRAYETVTVWFFVDGAPVSYTGTVDAYGFLTVEGVIL